MQALADPNQGRAGFLSSFTPCPVQTPTAGHHVFNEVTCVEAIELHVLESSVNLIVSGSINAERRLSNGPMAQSIGSFHPIDVLMG